MLEAASQAGVLASSGVSPEWRERANPNAHDRRCSSLAEPLTRRLAASTVSGRQADDVRRSLSFPEFFDAPIETSAGAAESSVIYPGRGGRIGKSFGPVHVAFGGCTRLGVGLSTSVAQAVYPPDEELCDAQHPNGTYEGEDGEQYFCVHDERLDVWHWEPVAGQTYPGSQESEKSIVYDDGPNTAFLQSRVEDLYGTLKGGSDHFARDWRYYPKVLPPGYIAAAVDIYRWSGSSWSLCTWSPWSYNSYYTAKWTPTFSFGSAPCGAGYYGTVAFGYHWSDGWRGGTLWSGYTYHAGYWLNGFAATAQAEAEVGPPPDGPPQGAHDKAGEARRRLPPKPNPRR